MNKWNRKTCLLKKKNDCWLRRDAAGLHESLGWIGCRPGSLTSSTSMCVSTPRWPPNGEGVTPQMDGVSTRLTIRPRLSYSVCVCSLHIASSFSPPPSTPPLLPSFSSFSSYSLVTYVPDRSIAIASAHFFFEPLPISSSVFYCPIKCFSSPIS